MDAEYYNKLIKTIEQCETMSDIQYTTELVHDFVDNSDIDIKHRHQLFNILSDKTFDVYIKEYPKSDSKKVVKKKTAKKTTAKKTTAKKTTAKKNTRRKKKEVLT